MKFTVWILAAGLAIASAGCRKKSQPTAESDPNPAGATSQVFEVKGVLKTIDENGRRAVIRHEEIPNYMQAMTMPFSVRDTNEVSGLKQGDALSFRLVVKGHESWIEGIKKTDEAQPAPPPAARPPVRLVRDVEPLDVGDVLPDYRFTNEVGKAVNLSDFRGKALAFTFIFTRCPLPDFCPLMSRNFSETAKKLAVSPDSPTNWHLLSISFDPTFDTPQVLKNYSRIFQPDTNRWNFVTGALIDIDAITEQFNLPVVKQGDSWDHKLRTVVVDASGKIQSILVGNQWTADDLAQEISKGARVKPADKQAP